MYSKELSYSNTQSATFYGRTEAKAVAGIAILMMVWHHLFGFPQWLLPGLSCNSIFGNSADVFVRLTASLGNTCIYIYAFSTGYVIYSQFQLYDTWEKRVTRIFKFLLSYWLVCVAFYIFGMVFNQPLPTLREAFLNSFGIKTGCGSNWINVVFAWYVNYYIVLIAFSSVLYKCFKKDKPLSLILSIIGCCISIIVLAYAQIGYWDPFFASLLGLLTAKYHFFDKITSHLKINNRITLFSCGGGYSSSCNF